MGRRQRPGTEVDVLLGQQRPPFQLAILRLSGRSRRDINAAVFSTTLRLPQ